jgi:formate hydrogenlyase subunit 3/multisubunit Na+/H+ antiporter MnhD subunit
MAMNDKQLKTIWLLFLALLMSIVVYAVVAVMIEEQGGPGVGEVDAAASEFFQNILLGVGAVSTLASIFVPGLVIRSRQGEALSYERLLTKKIIQWAISESIAILGLVLYFLTGDLDNMYIFAAWSAAVMLFHGPFGLHSQSTV